MGGKKTVATGYAAVAAEMTAERDAVALERDALRETLRDKLAAAALTGILTHGTHHTHDRVMADCYRYADEGLKVREVKAEVVEKVEAVVVTPPAGPQR